MGGADAPQFKQFNDVYRQIACAIHLGPKRERRCVMRNWLLFVVVICVLFSGSLVLAQEKEAICEAYSWAYFPYGLSCEQREYWTTEESYDCNCRTEARLWRCPVWINGNRYYRNSSAKLNVECFAIWTERVCDTCQRKIQHSRCTLYKCCTTRCWNPGENVLHGGGCGISECHYSRTPHCHDPNQ